MPLTFSDSDKIYSVDMMFAYVNIFKPSTTDIKVSDHLYLFNENCWGEPEKNIKLSPGTVLKNPKKYKEHYKRIKNADLSYPIMMYNGWIIDGVHRTLKAHLRGKKTLKAYVFPKDIFKKFLIRLDRNYEKVNKMNTHDYISLFYKRFCK